MTIEETVDLLRAIQDAVEQARAEDPTACALWWAGRSDWKSLALYVDVRDGSVTIRDRLGKQTKAEDILDWMYAEALHHPKDPRLTIAPPPTFENPNKDETP